MGRFLAASGAVVLLGAVLTWMAEGDEGTARPKASDKKAPENRFVFLDLKPVANHKLSEGFHPEHPGGPDNNLKELPTGEQTFAGVRFKIADKFIQLGSTNFPNGAAKVEGIAVQSKFARLHILHATEWAAEDDAIVGEYTVTWEDDTSVTIPIVYGKDVMDWWYDDACSEPSRGKVAWKGENDLAKQQQKKIRLYLTTWENSKPDTKVKTLDFASTKDTPAAPFCVAMTVEKK
jgi:hypothetical protein